MTPDRSTPNYLVADDLLRLSHGLDDALLDDVRAVGELFGPRVPELIEAFYGWLSKLPEYSQFLSSEQLLKRVKGQQAEYWRDFLKGSADGAYVQRRRVVGQVHARIELGLLIYLQAMEFVSGWFRREIAGEPRLRDYPLAAFSIRKLIEFDSAVVVDTYAKQTALRLEEQRTRLEHVAGVMRAVTEGDLSRRIEVGGESDILGSSLNEMVQSLSNIAREMGLIARGDYSAHVPPRSDTDQLGIALQAMTQALREAADRNEQYLWLAKSRNELSHIMSGNPSVPELSQRVLAHLCRALQAQIGALYLADADAASLCLTGTYACQQGTGLPLRCRLGEGLVGQVAIDKRRMLLDQMPADSIRIHWGLGESIPKHLVVLPLLHEDEVRGVVVIGTLGQFSLLHLDLLDLASTSVGLAISAAETRARVQQLLEESQAQGVELSAQQEELRQVNDTLAEQARALEAQRESLLATDLVLRQKASELERASRYKSEFLANMSHELRTPLNSSLILAKLLADNRQGNLTPEQVRFAQSISAAGNDLLALINDILDLSKIEAGKIDLHVEAVAIARLLSNLKHRFEPLAAEKGLALEISADPDCPGMVETDLQRVQQILTNLLSNAIKFTERGGVRLRVAPADAGFVAFTVEDTGIGIPPEQHEVVFEAFRQADGMTNRRFGGTGLGLSISRELAGILGGEIRLRSDPGRGSAFTVLIPIRSRHSTAPGTADAPAELTSTARLPSAGRVPDASEPADGKAAVALPEPEIRWPIAADAASARAQRLLLVIEDDPVFAQILSDLATEMGFTSVLAGSAHDGLRVARAQSPDAIVLDVGLPDQSGLSVLELLKRDPATRHIPVHMASVHDYQHIAREMGAVGYLRKPVPQEQLVAALLLLEQQSRRETKSLLIVEDDAVQREALTRLLAADQIRIVAVATANEALQQLRQTDFDCVVLDLMLPDVSGFDLLDRMSQDANDAYPPVIVYTARSLNPDEVQRLQRRSRSIIVKGARSPERLIEEVSLFLHQVESKMPAEKQQMLKLARERDTGLDGRRILLVEDDARNIFALTAALEPLGALIEIARNGKEALARLTRATPVDLILMDLMMPVMDGLEATREIRKINGLRAIPVIALTAKAMADDRQQCLAAGANDYISKPVDIDKLLSLIRIWMPQ